SMVCDYFFCFFFQAEDGIRDFHVTGVQTCKRGELWKPCTVFNASSSSQCKLCLFSSVDLLKQASNKKRYRSSLSPHANYPTIAETIFSIKSCYVDHQLARNHFPFWVPKIVSSFFCDEVIIRVFLALTIYQPTVLKCHEIVRQN